MRYFYFLFLIFLICQCDFERSVVQKEKKIKVLILTGRNNHAWKKTTPLLKKMYEECGRFKTDVTESPDTLSLNVFRQYDAIVSNWAAWPEHDFRWPNEVEMGLIKYIKEGGGFVLFHAASATFYDWPEFQAMIGTTWGDSTTHGKIKPHKISITDQSHPITDGISDFWITDELWVNAGINSELNVLATSYSDPSNKGRDIDEPVVHWNKKGKGRIFQNVLGHNERAMKNTGWKTLMLRGTEWAATGKVTIPVPSGLSKKGRKKDRNFSWQKTDTTLSLLNHDKIIWQYNYNTIKGKPFFHPVNINSNTLTWLSPEDHPWHLGLWHSWKYINGVNYWEYDLTKGVAPFNFLGITEVRNIRIEQQEDFSCKLYLQIYYHEKNGPDLIEEKRMVQVSAPDEEGQYYIDYSFNLQALVDSVIMDRTPLPHQENGKTWGGYAGLSVRFSKDFFDPTFINADRSNDMKHGMPQAWRYYGLKDIKGSAIGTAIFAKSENLNYPEPWFMTNSEDHPFYYFSPAPIFNQPHNMDRGDRIQLGYRVQFYANPANYEQLKRDHENYLKKK